MRHIQGDSLEQSRIRLERDIDNNILSPPSMSSELVLDEDDVSSVEFARHNSHPYPSFHSFEHPSQLDSDFYSRHGDDDSIALDPDLGHTLSTAAHHASALTLSAGLRGRGNYVNTTGRASPSGVEYDPDRPLQAIFDNRIADGISLFDATARTKSKSSKNLKQDQTRSLPTFDPVIVDSTAELDRFLRTGHRRLAVPRSGVSYPYISRSHSQPDPCMSDASDSDASTPRLSQALSSHFSPKRPRSAPILAPSDISQPPRPSNPTPSHSAHPPPPKLKHAPSNTRTTQPHIKRSPEAVPPSPGSHFSKLARGLARDIEAQSRPMSQNHEQEQDLTPRPQRRGIFPPAPAPVNLFPKAATGKRAPFSDLVNKEHRDEAKKRSLKVNPSARVHLPDVTGLTSAVQSPLKGGGEYANAHPSLAADLLPALDALQTRLQALERENGISRRRVRELEIELEECKVEVVKERTRVEERELVREERERERQVRGKMRQEEVRYHEVVQEKKALEALITTLRTHLARLTSELASNQSLITSLRAHYDTRARETHVEVEALRAEVERLGGEVERLKAIVEEGLRERRRSREESEVNASVREAMPAQVGIDLTYVTVPAPVGLVEEAAEREQPITVEDLEPEQGQEYEPEPDCEEDSELEFDPEPVSSRTHRYIQAAELARVEAEMRERRSERSLSKSSAGAQSRGNDSGNGSSLHEVEPQTDQRPSPASYVLRPSANTVHLQPPGRPVSRQRNVTPPKKAVPETPFPQIRGSRMERLFFSAPEHNARTCNVCHRRKRGEMKRPEPSWGRRAQLPRTREDDEGFEEGNEDEEALRAYLKNAARRGKGRDRRGDVEEDQNGDGDRLPPQTVLARVVRELEDDFSHYKAIYLELADQYGVMDAASNVAKRNVLADHLRDVIDTLEQKGDQIASLYDLLNFKDKPLPHGPFLNPQRTAFA